MVTGNQTDPGGGFRHPAMGAPLSSDPALSALCEKRGDIRKYRRKSDLSVVNEDESLGVIVMAPLLAGRKYRKERAPRNAVSGSARFVPWP